VSDLRSGLFVSFEGGEGTGKSTQIKLLAEALEKQGHSALLSWEPGGTPLGQKIRSLLIEPSEDPMSARCEALLYAAARAEHVDKKIKPALKAGKLVLCDRFIDASRAYQGWARGLGEAPITDISLWATEGILPDRVYVFDLDPNIGLERVKARQGGKLDRIEAAGLEFHSNIRKSYLRQASKDPLRYKVIDASQKLERVSEMLLEDCTQWLKSKIV